ncbi:DUF2254 domain-containing protein [Methylobacterium sp. J-068]|uniref:DUF2254 domain-containing protein n=1 Tax=Methylobacterium sp. J-068 TaxID=2836649 RepID=UPI001FBA662C|nr:DUF2254 domain-containing protein [Methylobacterium sp. J-068]MCJ2036945.1 DUF2254 domain-containing protein [Methylobacterium sp. J-068]
MSTAFYTLRRWGRRPFIRVAAFSVGGVVAALASAVLAPMVPADLGASIGADAVDQILSVLATSMLPVATFSLSTIVQAYGGATNTVTPRAVTLLMQDTRAQTAVASFIGAFVYSVVGLIALKTHFYGDQGRVILFGLTLLVLVSVVVTLVRWIDTLTHLGRVGETIDAIEAAASDAVRRRAEAPYLGGLPWAPAPAGAERLDAATTGYVQHVDAAALDALAEAAGLTLHLAVLPGTFVHPGRLLVAIDGATDAALRDRIAKAFVIGDRRTFDDDPRFGIIVLSEVAQRALSTSINDPGTAIDVIGTLVRVLALWDARRAAAPEAGIHPRLRVPGITAAELFEDAFDPIARDGAGTFLVGLRLQKALAALQAIGGPDFQAAARAHADLALLRAEGALTLEADLTRLREARATLA